jgi:DNA-binding transcriptional regulator YiaG
MVFTQQARPISSIKMKMNFLNQFHKSKIKEIKRKKPKRIPRIRSKNLISKEKYGKIINKYIWILIFKMTKK